MHCLDVHDESNDCTIVSFITVIGVFPNCQAGPLSS